MNQEIKTILTAKKIQAENLAKDNLEKAFSIPNFDKSFAKLKHIQNQNAKARAFGEKEDKLKENTALKNVNSILAQNQLKYDDLSPNYACKKCCDTGAFQGLECECVKKIRSELELKKGTFKNLKTFKDCNYSIFDSEQTKKVYQFLEKWAKTPEREKYLIVLQGGTGTGKTFLMECLASEFLNDGKEIIVKTSFEAVNEWLNYHTSFNKNELGTIFHYVDCDALFIDDLGTEPIFKNVTQEYLFSIINQRLKNKKITIISTNLLLESIKQLYGDRIFSRLVSKEIGYLFQLNNSDLRLKKHEN